jgi:hypothetical protein
MSRDEIIRALEANVDRAVRITFVDGEALSVTVINLDDEGFVHSVGGEFFWATFEDVSEVESEGESPLPAPSG